MLDVGEIFIILLLTLFISALMFVICVIIFGRQHSEKADSEYGCDCPHGCENRRDSRNSSIYAVWSSSYVTV
ncbi:hypothetical protein QR680_006134 [Steinernema hermaphroditum]|uniref:Uncharacterized protein n=1 Tax=Steinernema hermaphroditum TaxID=289476 RepID=A0AA39HVT2_9BILA|nr:hypothetical protein QR680_006134 [Steinernema hermaphroditum]